MMESQQSFCEKLVIFTNNNKANKIFFINNCFIDYRLLKHPIGLEQKKPTDYSVGFLMPIVNLF